MSEIFNNSMPFPDSGNLDQIFDLESLSLEERETAFSSRYTYNGYIVPRVSEVLKNTINKEFLMNWAARLGFKYIHERDRALDIGSQVHELIENYLINGNDLPIKKGINFSSVDNAYYNFKCWYNRLKSLGYNIEVIAIEKELICPFYGGTADLIARINGVVYIIDFKSSSKITYDYILQTCAYRWIINNGYSDLKEYIGGIGIIRIDKKKKGVFEDLFFNSFDGYQDKIMEDFTIAFGSMLNWYYNLTNIKYLFDQYRYAYNFQNTISFNNPNGGSIDG